MSRSKDIFSILIQLAVAGLVIIFTGYLLPGIVVDDWITGVIIAALLALLNLTIKPILIFLTIPITILTLGLFLLVINALLVMLAAALIQGFTVDNFWWALLFSLVLSLVNSILGISLGNGLRR
ncbi:phage holin family protein [Cyclobacterium jeungdonense]|uniref:Phage holin family protein n=1 Tax=Cyclobacterium jeungdonense TaxID=708087 RepID=A0ABT8CCN6_9BACT|nr:phage holin family protein [Cyclobacterium jeungdonense]MDN3690565.1 phage holin family protein [Cyclobacterium jeungdonense]